MEENRYATKEVIESFWNQLKEYYGEELFYKEVAKRAEIIKEAYTKDKNLMREVIYDIVDEDYKDSEKWIEEIAFYECALELIE